MEQTLFGDPFYNHIINYLNPTTLYNLCQTCKQYRLTINKPYFERSTIAIMRSKLYEIYGTQSKVNHVLNNLKEGVITGYCIVQLILNENIRNLLWCYYPNTSEFDDEYDGIKDCGNDSIYRPILFRFFKK